MQHNPIDIIKQDHKTVASLFAEYDALGDRAFATKRAIVDQVIEELTIHAEMEEVICYPRFKEVFNKEDDKMVDEAYVEHAGVKQLLANLEALDPEQPEFDATMKVLMEQVRHHVKEEEEELLPEVEKQVPDAELVVMAEEMRLFKHAHGAEV